ncbi:MAG: O-antigen ligase family protein, partial [Thermodesulfobacteriota bacterium]|nr:O-antigen ligase family protein [Thermodesulfobacteriota bacterium]
KEALPSIILIISIFLAFIVLLSTKTWIPILICVLIVRDFSLVDLVGGGGLKIGDMLIGFLFSIWLCRDLLMRHSTQLVKSKLDLYLLLFLVLYIISLSWSTDLEYGFVRISKLIRNFCFYIIIRDLFIKDFHANYKKITIAYIMTGITLGIVYLSVLFLAGSFVDYSSLFQKETLSSVDLGTMRVRGTGGGFLISGPSMWFMAAGTFIFGSLILNKSGIVRSVKIFLAILMFTLSIGTLSRTPLAMLMVVLTVLLWGNLKLGLKKNVRTLALILIFLAGIGMAFGFTKLYSKRLTNMFEDQSWTHRTKLYETAVDAFLHSPIWGIGPGSNFSWQMKYPWIEPSRLVHSVYFLIISELGLLGSIVFVTMIYFWIKYLWDCMWSSNGELYVRSICMTMFAFSVGYLLYMWFVGEFEAFEPWLMMGIASAIKNLDMRGVNTNNHNTNRGISKS